MDLQRNNTANGSSGLLSTMLGELTSWFDGLERVLNGPEAVQASTEVMQQFAQEFAKGIEAWGNILGTALNEKKP